MAHEKFLLQAAEAQENPSDCSSLETEPAGASSRPEEQDMYEAISSQSEGEHEGLMNPIARHRVKVIWGSRMDEFGDRALYQILKNEAIQLNHSGKPFDLPTRFVESVVPALAESLSVAQAQLRRHGPASSARNQAHTTGFRDSASSPYISAHSEAAIWPHLLYLAHCPLHCEPDRLVRESRRGLAHRCATQGRTFGPWCHEGER